MACTINCAYEYGGFASSLGDLPTTRDRPLPWPTVWRDLTADVGLIADAGLVADAGFTTETRMGTTSLVSLAYAGGTQTSSVSSDIGTTSVVMLLSSTISDVDSFTYAFKQLQSKQCDVWHNGNQPATNYCHTSLTRLWKNKYTECQNFNKWPISKSEQNYKNLRSHINMETYVRPDMYYSTHTVALNNTVIMAFDLLTWRSMHAECLPCQGWQK